MKNTFSIGACGAVLLSLLLLSSCAYESFEATKATRRAADFQVFASMRAEGKPVSIRYFRCGRTGLGSVPGNHIVSISDFSNLSQKTIKYFHLDVRLLNSVGDKAYDSVTRSQVVHCKATGPIEPIEEIYDLRGTFNDDMNKYYLTWGFYCDDSLGQCKYSGVIHYMDGTSKSFGHEEFLSWILPSQ